MNPSCVCGVAAAFALVGCASARPVFPTLPHAANNFIPFAPGTAAVPVNNSTMHQVFASSLFSTATGGLPAQINSIGFAHGINGTYNGNITINFGYTNAVPGVASASGGLQIPPVAGGGPNANGPMSGFFSNPAFSIALTGAATTNFSQFVFPGSFVYNPAQGNLLVEIICSATLTGNIDLSVSRSAGGAESSRAYATTRFGNAESPTTATRMDFTFVAVPTPGAAALLGLAGLIASRRRR